MLQKGEHVPHFRVCDLSGREVSYRAIWQRKHLLLVELADDSRPPAIGMEPAELELLDAAIVITRDAVDGVPRPGVLIADRWGEIAVVAEGEVGAGAPGGPELAAWLRDVQQRCPECEGESR